MDDHYYGIITSEDKVNKPELTLRYATKLEALLSYKGILSPITQ